MKKMYKIFLCFTLVFSISVSIFSNNITVYADSNSRSKNWIALGAERGRVSSLGTDEFSYDEMRILGIFLSNFYIPWSTQINNANDSEADVSTKNNMVRALTDSLNFDQSVAEGLVNAVYSMSQSSAKELYIDFENAENPEGAKCSYANMITAFLSSKFTEGSDINIYWKDDSGNKHTVFSGENCKEGACSYVLSSILSQLNLSSGYGSAFLGTSVDSENSGKLTKEDVNNWTSMFADPKEGLTSCALGQQMYVDCFGNIICDNGQGRAFIVVPACLNPYTFIKDGYGAGDAMPVNNLYFMSLNSSGNLVKSGSTPSMDKLTLNNIKFRSKSKLYTISRGTKITDFDTSGMFWNGGNGGELVNDLTNAYQSSDFHMCNADSKFSGGDVKVYLYGGSSPYQMNSYTETVIQDWILFDFIGGFSSENTDTMSRNEYGIFGKNWGSLRNPVSQSFSTGVDKDNAFNMMTDENSKCYLAGIFCSYVFAYFNSDGLDYTALTDINNYDSDPQDFSEDFDINVNDESGDSKVKYRINLTGLPSGGEGTFSISISDNQLDNMLKTFMYYILHPVEGGAYIKQWFSKITSNFLLKAHEGIVGNTSTNNTTGGSRYLGFSGYVTVPNLHDLAWTQWLLDSYDSFFIYFIILMILILIGYIFLGSITMQKGIISILVFAVCAYLPPTLINTTVDYSNKVCDVIYGSKFTYWALVQHEMYVDEINAALSQENNSTYSDFLLAQFNSQSDYTSSSSTSVAVKWLAPKKDNYLVNFKREIEETAGENNLGKVIEGLMSERVSGETYVGGSNDMFLYRSYSDIGTYSTSSYNWLRNNKGTSNVAITSNITGIKTDSGVDLGDSISEAKYLGNRVGEYSLQYAVDNGFNYPTQGVNYDAQYNYRIIAPLMSNIPALATKNGLKNLSLGSTKFTGITQNNFNITVANLNNNSGVTDKTYGTFVFGEYTESPYYYFSFNLNDQIDYSKVFISGFNSNDEYSYKNLFLQGDGDYFYNNSNSLNGSAGYGELRDFMDMRSLFYCVIPYLKEANDVVRQWDKEYGLWLYNGVDVTYTDDYKDLTPPTTDKDSELYYKWWHNVMVCQLFNMYTPWLDKMYDCDYAKPQKITVHGEKFEVKDPLDPYSYYRLNASGKIEAGRYMIFSESEMQYYGLTYSDLTTVEKKIINIQKNSYADLLELMDYYTFDDEVLNTASAMIETFNFNKEFSQTSLFKEDYVLYPQNYELKNFTYDAYLRLILVNATGENLQSSDEYGKSVNLYSTILENTSFVTGVLMIGLDVIATYVIPALKLFFLLAVFVLSLFVLVAAILNIQVNVASVMMDSLIKPLIQFLLTSIGMAFAVSLFMSDGNTSVTGRGRFTISLGDPTMTIIVMLAINIVVVVLYWKICKKTFINCKKYAEATLASIGGTFSGVINKLTGTSRFAVGLGVGAITAIPRGIKGAKGMHDRGLQNKANRAIADGASPNSGYKPSSSKGADSSYKPNNSKGINSNTSKMEAKANKWNAKVQSGKNSNKIHDENQKIRHQRTEAYNNLAKDPRAGFITKGKASVLGKVSKADENIHSLGQKVKNTKAVSAVRSINNSKNQYIADRTSARSDLKKIRKNAKSNIGKSKKHA